MIREVGGHGLSFVNTVWMILEEGDPPKVMYKELTTEDGRGVRLVVRSRRLPR